MSYHGQGRTGISRPQKRICLSCDWIERKCKVQNNMGGGPSLGRGEG